jgi:hypothetical protein
MTARTRISALSLLRQLVAGTVATIACGGAAQERPAREWPSHHPALGLQHVMRTPMTEQQTFRNFISRELPADDRSDRSLSQPEGATREIGVFGSSAVVLELGRIGPDGRFVRPRIMVGRNSPELRYWLHEAGIRAERCMLPMVRTRAKRDPESGKLGATVMLSARCTFY